VPTVVVMSVMPPPAFGSVTQPGSDLMRVLAQVSGLVAAAVLVGLAVLMGAA